MSMDLTSDSLLILNIVCMKFLFPDFIIIRYKHNHTIGVGGVAPAALRAVNSPVRFVLCLTLKSYLQLYLS